MHEVNTVCPGVDYDIDSFVVVFFSPATFFIYTGVTARLLSSHTYIYSKFSHARHGAAVP